MSERGKSPGSKQHWFLPGNQAARRHGAYARYHAPEIIERVTPDAPSPDRIESLIQLEEARLHSLLQEKAAWDAKSEYGELAHSDYPLTEVRKDHLGTATKQERPDFERLIDRSMGRIAALVAEKERIQATPAYVATLTSELFERAEQEGLAAVDTAALFERSGLAVPFSLQQKVRAELALAEPPEPEGGVTDDELERLSREYEEKVEGEVAWLEQRRIEVEQIHKAKEREKHSE